MATTTIPTTADRTRRTARGFGHLLGYAAVGAGLVATAVLAVEVIERDDVAQIPTESVPYYAEVGSITAIDHATGENAFPADTGSITAIDHETAEETPAP